MPAAVVKGESLFPANPGSVDATLGLAVSG